MGQGSQGGAGEAKSGYFGAVLASFWPPVVPFGPPGFYERL